MYCNGRHSEDMRTLCCKRNRVPNFCGTTGVTKDIEVINGGGGWSPFGSLKTAPARGDVGEHRHSESRKGHARKVQTCGLVLEGVLYRGKFGI